MNKRMNRIPKKIQVPKECYFCAEKKTPWYNDIASLQRFTTDRGKIIPRARNGVCALHQRRMAAAIKYARHLALMPFVVRD